MKSHKYLKALFCICLVLGISTPLKASDISATSVNNSKQEKAQNEPGSYDHLSGTWKGKVPLGDIYLELQVKGSSVSGTVRAVGGIKDGKIEGNKITFYTIRQENSSIIEIPFEGVIKKDKIHFSFISVNNGRPVKFTAKKMKSDLEEEQAVQESEGPNKHIAGKWTANYLNGVMSMDFKVKGNKLTGTVSPMESTQNKIRGGKIKDNKIYFYCPPNTLIRQRTEWEGTIVGDKIQFTARVPANTFKFTAKKVVPAKKDQVNDEIHLPPTVKPSGTWIMEANGQQITLSLKAIGMSLTGLVRMPPLNSNIMIPPDARISGDTISFSITKRIGPNLFRIPWVGKVVGNEIHFEGGPFNQFEDVIAKKIKDSDGYDTGKLLIKLIRIDEIKNSNINDKYKKLRNEDNEYDSAMSYFDEYRYSFSLPLMEQLIKRLPDDPVALHRLGVCLIMQSIYPPETKDQKDMRVRARGLLEKAKNLGIENEMLDYYLKVIPDDGGDNKVFSNQKKAEELITEAERSFALRDFQTSIGLYARAMEMDPTNYSAVLYIGDSYFANGQNKEAMEWFELATKVDPDKETAWRYWGDCLMRMDKKEEGRSKFIDALIAEPYNQLSWNGIRNLVNMNRVKLETPDIKRPQRIDATGELVMSEKSGDIDDDQKKPALDVTDAWVKYNEVAKEWRATKFKEKFPGEEYRHTLDEEKEALELVAVKVNDAVQKGEINSNDLNAGIKTLLKLHSSGLLEPYILFHLADRDIIIDYPAYRKSNRSKLEQYLDMFEVPKTVEQRES